MIYSETNQDLFTLDDSWSLAHCISADAKMGAGIATEFKRRFDLSQTTVAGQRGRLTVGTAHEEHISGQQRIFNLITKEKYYQKPTYDSLTQSLIAMRNQAIDLGVKRIAMPKIGAGLDRLNWAKNRAIIKEIFEDTDIEINVCYL